MTRVSSTLSFVDPTEAVAAVAANRDGISVNVGGVNVGGGSNHDDDSPYVDRVCLIGSGAWGSAIATKIGRNCQRMPHLFEERVNMWVFEEMVTIDDDDDNDSDGKHQQHKLSTIINNRHENIKYLPGIILPDNVVAVPDLATACEGATLLIFVLPHQFLPTLLPTIRQHVHPTQCRAVSLIKGIEFDPITKSPILISQGVIVRTMRRQQYRPDDDDQQTFQCGVLMGANVATEVAAGMMCESTLACDFSATTTTTTTTDDLNLNERTRLVLDSPTTNFRVQHSTDVAGAEVCGALKNVIALGAGFVDSLGYGSNTKAALMRVGLKEIAKFGKTFFGDTVLDQTFLESCGVADLITTCYNGRNRKCAEEWARRRATSSPDYGTTTSPLATEKCEILWNEVETSMLNGQKLQGTLTAKDCYQTIHSRGLTEEFPLHTTIYKICGWHYGCTHQTEQSNIEVVEADSILPVG